MMDNCMFAINGVNTNVLIGSSLVLQPFDEPAKTIPPPMPVNFWYSLSTQETGTSYLRVM